MPPKVTTEKTKKEEGVTEQINIPEKKTESPKKEEMKKGT
jgi:hypothetical protein